MKMIKLSFCLFLVLLLFSSCGNPFIEDDNIPKQFSVTFHRSENISGTLPKGILYTEMSDGEYDILSLSITACDLEKEGFYLYSWNTAADGSGIFIPKEGFTLAQSFRYAFRAGLGNYKELINLHPIWIKNGSTFFINPISDHTARIELAIVNEETITVPDTLDGYTITSISESFSWFQGLAVRAIIFPNSVTDIASGALWSPDNDQHMYDNNQLTSVILPNSLKTLNDYLFAGCTNITSIILPATITEIGEGCFHGCSSLASIILPESLRTIEYETFSWCTNLTSINLPDTIETIGERAFDGCSSLLSIEMPDSLEEIDTYAFWSCTNLTTVTNIPNTLTTLPQGIFESCSSLTSIILPTSLKVIDDYAFDRCSSLISIVLPDSIERIDNFAFLGTSNLTSIVFPDNLVSIGDMAFYDCTSLQIAEFKNAHCVISVVPDSLYTPFSNTSPLFKIRAPSGGTVNAFCTESGIPFEPTI